MPTVPKPPISPDQKVQCLSLKAKASKTAKLLASSAIDKAKTLGIQLLSSLVSQVLSTYQALRTLVLNAQQQLEDAYYGTIAMGEKLAGDARDKYIAVVELKNKLLTPTACTPTIPIVVPPPAGSVKSNITIDTNIIAELAVLPSSNDTALSNSSTDYKEKKNLEDSKSQTLSKQLDVAENISQTIKDSGVSEMREKVRGLTGIHPFLDDNLKQLPLFTPVSEYIGSWLLGFNLDKSNVQLQYWNDGTPKSVRYNLTKKLNSDTINEIEKAYTITNQGLCNNISNEFIEAKTVTDGQPFAPGYHIMGDYSFFDKHIGSQLGEKLTSSILQNLGDLVYMINYITTVKENLTIENTPFTTIEENYSVLIDNRKNLLRKPVNTVNIKGLTPNGNV